jgi:hypothetical protein
MTIYSLGRVDVLRTCSWRLDSGNSIADGRRMPKDDPGAGTLTSPYGKVAGGEDADEHYLRVAVALRIW